MTAIRRRVQPNSCDCKYCDLLTRRHTRFRRLRFWWTIRREIWGNAVGLLRWTRR